MEGHNSWFKHIMRVLKFCNIDHLLYSSDDKEITSQLNKLKRRLHAMFIEVWKKERTTFQKDSKLDLFTSLKNKFEISDYLKIIKNPSHRIALSKMRVSAHKFPIETGRYNNTPREERLCPFGCNCIGDEYHYILNCSHPFI